MNKPKILVVGSFVMDLVVTTNRFPSVGETVLGCDFTTAPGGKGANQAIQAARLGVQVDMIGCVGNDMYGKTLLKSAQDAGVGIKHVQINDTLPSAVGNVQIEAGADGYSQNRIIVVSGSNMAITLDSVEFLNECIGNYDMVLLQLEIPTEINEAVINIAAYNGVPVMLNPAPAKIIGNEVLSKISYLIPNETEAALLTDIHIRDKNESICFTAAEQAAEKLLENGVENVIITLGDAGALCATKDGVEHCPSIDIGMAVDPTAAGDSFIGAFAVEKAIGKPNKEAMSFACAAAAITVSRKGAQPSLPKYDEVLDLLAVNKKEL